MINLPNGHHGRLQRIHKRRHKAWILNVIDRDDTFVKSFGPYTSARPAIREAKEFLAA